MDRLTRVAVYSGDSARDSVAKLVNGEDKTQATPPIVEVSDTDWGEIGKPEVSDAGALRIKATRDDQVKEWLFAPGSWSRAEFTAKREQAAQPAPQAPQKTPDGGNEVGDTVLGPRVPP